MKLVARWLALAGLVLITACSLNHRSDEFACEKQSDCSTGRSCIEGFCVAAQVDAGAAGCPSQCTSCKTDTKSCTIDCALNGGACNASVVCPTGWSCNIACSIANSCRNGINCSNSKSCTITCAGKSSCLNFTCGPGPCNIDCIGQSSCSNVSCAPSCACDLTCRTGASCSPLTCKSLQCTLPNRAGCTSLGLGCNTCR